MIARRVPFLVGGSKGQHALAARLLQRSGDTIRAIGSTRRIDLAESLTGDTGTKLVRKRHLVNMPWVEMENMLPVFSDVEVSIDWAFAAPETHEEAGLPDPIGAIKDAILERGFQYAPESDGILTMPERMYNDLETVVLPRYLELEAHKRHVLDCGAHRALLCGRSSAVIRIFGDHEATDAAVTALRDAGLNVRKIRTANGEDLRRKIASPSLVC